MLPFPISHICRKGDTDPSGTRYREPLNVFNGKVASSSPPKPKESQQVVTTQTLPNTKSIDDN